MADRRPAIVAGTLLALAALIVIGAAAVEVLAEAPEPASAPVRVDPPDQGVLHCPVTAGEEETAALVVVPAGDEPTRVTVLRYDGGVPARDEPVELEAGGVHTVVLEDAAAQQPVGVRWEGGAAVATWLVEGGVAGAPCEAVALPSWHVAGFDTTAQNDSTLHLFNPFAVDAVVRVTFGTPSGRVALVLTDNVLVPARSSVRLDLNEYEPEQPELAATVDVLTGRVVALGELAMTPTEHQPGPSGRTLLPAVGAPAVEWAFGAARHSEQDASWIVAHNPGERDAAVEVRVTDPAAGAELLGREFMVPAGATSRIELTEASEHEEFGVVLTSVNDVPVVATRLTHTAHDDGEDVAASVGSAPAERWAVAGGRTDGHAAGLSLTNPTGAAVRARVDVGPDTPEAWGAVEIAPNGQASVDLAELGERGPVPLRVHADAPVVPDLRVLAPGEDVRLWTSAFVPSSAWEGPGWRPPVRRDSTLSTTPIVPSTDAPVDGSPLD